MALLVPVLIFVGVVLWQFAQAERQRLERDALAKAESVAVGIDRELAGLVDALDVLTLSRSLVRGDLRDFHETAQQVEQRQGVTVVLRDRAGNILLASSAPYGSALPPQPNFEADQPNLDTGKVYITDFFRGPTTGQPYFAMQAPVYRDDEVVYFLAFAVSVERLREVIRSERAPPEWTLAVVDRKGIIMARNRSHEAFVGTQATEDLLENTRTFRRGTWLGTTKEGAKVLGAHVRSRLADWVVAVGIREELFDAPLERFFLLLIGMGAVITAFSALLAYGFGRRIATAIHRLVENAQALARAEPVAPLATPIIEVNEVSRALAGASRAVEYRIAAEEEAAAAGRRIQTIFESVTDSVFVLDRDWRFTYVNDRASAQMSGGRDVIGQSIWEVFPEAADTPFWTCCRNAMESGEPGRCETFFAPLGIWIQVNAYPSAEGLSVYFRDITEEKEAETRQHLMVRELHHRVKNTLATVQAIFNSTARSATDLEAFRDSFSRRIQSLARTHTLLTERSWERISLRDVVQGELDPYGGAEGRIVVDGPEIELPAQSGFALGMGLHELATNAGKYGALSVPGGQVKVRWTVQDGQYGQDMPVLRLTWQERGGPPARPPERTGFGSRLLSHVLPVQIGGKIEIDYAAEGLSVRIEAPLTAAQ